MKKVLVLFLFMFFFVSKGFCYNLADDWSNTNNPNGVWSYNAGDNPLPSSVVGWPLNEFGGTQRAWANGNVLHDTLLPAWLKSLDTPINPGGNDWLSGDVLVHSADLLGIQKYGPANVTWTSPATGIYDIYGGLWAARDIGRSNDWKLYDDDVLLAFGSLYTGDSYSRSNPDTFSFDNVFLSQGSVLKLEVVSVDSGDDFVGVNFNISLVAAPEPISSTLFLVGGVLMLAAKFRKKLNLFGNS